MKAINFFAGSFLLLLLSACSVEQNETFDTAIEDAHFRTEESTKQHASSDSKNTVGELCYQTRLIAGQHYDAGLVSVYKDGENLMITYQTYEGWYIDATHLSIGNCEDESIPTTGSGNPKVGKFEHATTNANETTTVTYLLDVSVLEEQFCFAAHAEVSGPTGGETAWAEGTDFDGNNWAMFVEALLSGCEDNGDGPVLF